MMKATKMDKEQRTAQKVLDYAVPAGYQAPYLVQRLRRLETWDLQKGGVDGVAKIDYMGAAEFEFGALPRALKEMRKRINELSVLEIRLGGRWGLDGHFGMRAYYVGRSDMAAHAEYWLIQELRGKHRGKEATWLRRAYKHQLDSLETRWEQDSPTDVIGWWALDQETPWVVFKDEATAQKWFEALKAGKPPKA